MPPRPSSRGLAVLLGALAMFGPFSIDTIFPAFRHIGAQFGVGPVAMQQTLSAYLLAYAAMSVVHGPLSDALGRKRVIMAGLVAFVLASVGCAQATSLPMLLAFRVMQGLSAGVGLIVGRAVVRDMLHGEHAQRLMSQVTMVFSVAPAIAPVIGGWILGWTRWPGIFWFLAVFASLLLAAVWWRLPETHPPPARQSLRPAPLLRGYVEIFRNPRFQRLAAAAAFNFAALFLYIASAPAFVMGLLHLGERQFAWFFMPMIGGMMLGAWASGRMAGRVDATRQVGIGFACCGIAVAANLAYNLFVVTLAIPWAVLPAALNAFGIALVAPVLALAILDMYPQRRGGVSSMQAFTQLVLNAVVAGLLSPLLSAHGAWLAYGAAGFALLAWLCWRWELRTQPRFALHAA